MTDTMTPEKRHWCMSRIGSKGTKPEMAVRRWLWQHGYRYRLNVKSVPGKPDIVMRRYRTAIFVNGCFWHGHQACGAFRLPKSNTLFWQAKIERNRERDERNYRLLSEHGWQVVVVWECQLKPACIDATMLKVEMLLNDNLIARYRRPVACDEEREPGYAVVAAKRRRGYAVAADEETAGYAVAAEEEVAYGKDGKE